MQLTGHRVFITGGNRGLGLELARGCLARGAAVATCARDAARLAEAARESPGLVTFTADLTDLDALPGLVTRLLEAIGPPTILVNNAGVQYNIDWLETPAESLVERIRTEVDLNLTAPMALTALLLEHLIEAPTAAVVNVSSLLGVAPKRSAPAYCATKAGMRSFTAALRYQLEDHPNVRVLEVIPALIDTAMTTGRGSDKQSPADAAAEVLAALEADRDEVWLHKARVVRILNRLAPGTVRRILRKS